MNTTKNEGRNVKRIREILGVKQDALATDLGVSQQRMSDIEQKETIDDALMEQIAAILKVPADAIRNFDEEKAVNIIANTFNNHDNSTGINANCTQTFNPIEKVIELYERLLQNEKEKNALLQKMLDEK